MAGLFPENGVVAQETIAASFPLTVANGCDPLFHKALCVPRFDPIAANAIISELVNAININTTYDCRRLDNLATTLKKIGSICNLEVATAAELVPATSFGICVAGENKKITWKIMLDALQPNLCNMDEVEEAEEADSVAGCFGDESGRISITNLRNTLLNFCQFQGAAGPLTNTDSVVGCFGNQRRRVTLNTLADFIVNICGWIEAPSPPDTASFAMCISGQRRRIELSDLRDAILNFCGLTEAETIQDTDSVAGCFGGASRRVTVADLRAKLASKRVDAAGGAPTFLDPSTSAGTYIRINTSAGNIQYPRFAEVGPFQANVMPSPIQVSTGPYERWSDNPVGDNGFYVAFFPTLGDRNNPAYRPAAVILPIYPNPSRQGSIPYAKITKLPGDNMLYCMGADGSFTPLFNHTGDEFYLRPLYSAALGFSVRWAFRYGVYQQG